MYGCITFRKRKVVLATGKRLSECEDCEYTRQAECFPCGSEDFPKKCDYMYAWCQTLEELAQLREVINFYDSIKSDYTNKQCTHEKNSVFCVKNYSL